MLCVIQMKNCNNYFVTFLVWFFRIICNKITLSHVSLFATDTDNQKILYVILCAIWYHLYILKNVRNPHGGLLLLVACNFTKSKTPWVFFTFFKLYKWYQIAQRTTQDFRLASFQNSSLAIRMFCQMSRICRKLRFFLFCYSPAF